MERDRDHLANWSVFYERYLRAEFDLLSRKVWVYRGRRKIRLEWRGWLPNPPIHQSYARHRWRYCFKFVASHCRVDAEKRGCVHWERSGGGKHLGGWQVLSSLSSVGPATSWRENIELQAWKLIRRWLHRKKLPDRFFHSWFLPLRSLQWS